MPLTQHEVEQIATKAAREAVKETLRAMGVNVEDGDDYIEIQKDFAHIRSWRRSVDTVRGTAIKTGVTVIVTGLLGALWMIFKPAGH